MEILVDSGGSKTQVALLGSGGVLLQEEGMGLHPDFVTDEAFYTYWRNTAVFKECQAVNRIVFYGAGLSNTQSIDRYTKLLQSLFPNATISIEHDILASARATCGAKPGVACILGTGTNSCLYDGSVISKQRLSLGYLLGDEGSGAYFGKQFLKIYLEGCLPKKLELAFEYFAKRTKKDWVVALNQGGNAKSELASVMPFLKANEKNAFIAELITAGFEAFVQYHLDVFPEAKNYPVNFCGSIAYHFKEQLTVVLEAKGYTFGKVISKPMDALVEYHLGISF